jgi:signal transduction histidine kinase
VRHELGTAKIELELDLGVNLPPVAIDRMQIQQVFVNVFLNAIQAMPGGGVLRVRTFARETSETAHFEGSRSASRLWRGEMAAVTEIDDTGPGIDEANLARIFDPFFTTKPTGVGTGLGLPVSKKIIDLHGGTIDVRNRPGGGVRVTVSLKATKPSS